LIETAGLMPTLTDHVITLALDQLLAWREEHLPVLSVAVNLSASSVADPTLPDRIINALRSRGLPGTVLYLEITEQCLIENGNRAGQVLEELRAYGVRISIDDFGTGYSSLTYLRNLPIAIRRAGLESSTASGRAPPPAECGLRPNAASGHLSGCPPTARTLAIARSLCEPAS
jgi:EAL domain-containing protein (putative c-di-GMP-specific phosphodiesterase class I)